MSSIGKKLLEMYMLPIRHLPARGSEHSQHCHFQHQILTLIYLLDLGKTTAWQHSQRTRLTKTGSRALFSDASQVPDPADNWAQVAFWTLVDDMFLAASQAVRSNEWEIILQLCHGAILSGRSATEELDFMGHLMSDASWASGGPISLFELGVKVVYYRAKQAPLSANRR